MDAALGSFLFWLVGFGVAFGKNPSEFIGESRFFLRKNAFTDDEEFSGYGYASWFFQ